MIYFLIALLSSLPDLLIKRRMESQPDSFFPHTVGRTGIQLHRHHNYGFCMNQIDHHPGLVRVGASFLYGIALLFTHHQVKEAQRKEKSSASDVLWLSSLALILGGGASNLIDRFRLGYVVDYFSLPIRRIRHIIMNIGDLCIFAGCALMAIAGLTEE